MRMRECKPASTTTQKKRRPFATLDQPEVPVLGPAKPDIPLSARGGEDGLCRAFPYRDYQGNNLRCSRPVLAEGFNRCVQHYRAYLYLVAVGHGDG